MISLSYSDLFYEEIEDIQMDELEREKELELEEEIWDKLEIVEIQQELMEDGFDLEEQNSVHHHFDSCLPVGGGWFFYLLPLAFLIALFIDLGRIELPIIEIPMGSFNWDVFWFKLYYLTVRSKSFYLCLFGISSFFLIFRIARDKECMKKRYVRIIVALSILSCIGTIIFYILYLVVQFSSLLS